MIFNYPRSSKDSSIASTAFEEGFQTWRPPGIVGWKSIEANVDQNTKYNFKTCHECLEKSGIICRCLANWTTGGGGSHNVHSIFVCYSAYPLTSTTYKCGGEVTCLPPLKLEVKVSIVSTALERIFEFPPKLESFSLPPPESWRRIFWSTPPNRSENFSIPRSRTRGDFQSPRAAWGKLERNFSVQHSRSLGRIFNYPPWRVIKRTACKTCPNPTLRRRHVNHS